MPTRPVPVIATVEQGYIATKEYIFDAWVDPEMIVRFLVGPDVRDETVTSIEVDARTGGSFTISVDRNGTETVYSGTYLAFKRPDLLAFTWYENGVEHFTSNVTITLSEGSVGAALKLEHELDARLTAFRPQTESFWKHRANVLRDIVLDYVRANAAASEDP